MRRVLLFTFVFAVLISACGVSDDAEESEDSEVPHEIVAEGEVVVTASVPVAEDDDDSPFEISTLLPSGVFGDDHWIKWKLDAPIPDPGEQYTRTYQLNIRSAEDDVFGVGWTVQQGEEPFASSFCLDDRPNCGDGTVAVDVEIGPEANELVFRIPLGTFGNATGLRISAFIQTWETVDSDLVTENVGDGAPVPLMMDERDPC